MDRRQISPGFVEDALGVLRRRGIDPAPLLAESGIAELLGGPVSNIQYGRLWLAISRCIDDEFFGLAARAMRPGSYVLMGHAVLHAKTLEHALRRALRFLDVVLEKPCGTLHVRGEQAVIVLRDAAGTQPAFANRTFWLFLLGMMCWLIGRRIALTRVEFACPAPPNRQDYHHFFGAPVHFDQPESCLSFSAHYLALPTIRDEKALKTFLRGAPANILLRYRHDQGLSTRVRARLRAMPATEWPEFDALAANLQLSPATLRRRLRSEGQSYSGIRDELRYTQATQLLHKSQSSVSDISAMLGYAEPSAFYRAFLKWSGKTPAAFRKEP